MLMQSGKVLLETSTTATVATKLLKEHIVLGYDIGLQASRQMYIFHLKFALLHIYFNYSLVSLFRQRTISAVFSIPIHTPYLNYTGCWFRMSWYVEEAALEPTTFKAETPIGIDVLGGAFTSGVSL